NSLAKLQRLNLNRVFWLQNNFHRFDGLAIGGTRGWALPGTEFCKTPEDQTIYEREVARLKLSLESLPKEARRVGMLHYPPLLKDIRDTGFTRLFEQFEVDRVVYGHLHLGHLARAFEGVHNGVTYRLVSCDVIDFAPAEI
ncbi:MAG: metallophosphoesterase, partial [Candidatus Xenobia bacterium]